MQELIQKIEKWADDKGITEYGTVEGQIKKTIEELTELAIAIFTGDKKEIIDSIGDVFVTLVVGNKLNKNFDFMDLYTGETQKDIMTFNDDRGWIDICGESINNLLFHFNYSEDVLFYNLDVLIGICKFYNLDLKYCVEVAYNEIKDRKGKMINGTFVKEEVKEEVDHPDHYNFSTYETYQEMLKVFGKATVREFCLCNVWKYRARAPYKGNAERDMEKADWYMQRYMELLRDEQAAR